MTTLYTMGKQCAASVQQNTLQSFKTGSCYIALTSLELERNLILIHGTSQMTLGNITQN